MYPKYNRCPPKAKLIDTPACCLGQTSSPGPGAIPESVRVASEQCNKAWLTTPDSKLNVTVIPGTPPPYAVVQSVPASVTTRNNALTTVALSVDPYNPATRFSQYFPPPPIPAPCPVRPQVIQPPPLNINCVPVTRFKGSSLDEP